ncbi:MAG: alkyl hydroperoxide reductase, partial [Pseudomonadota bacterium]
AGSHQIWVLDLSKGGIATFAGTGREGLDDGDRHEATFSQPSGLAIAGRWLYVADAEASAVRRIHLDRGRVETVVGTGLFDFGDRDGGFGKAQLQHPAGILALESGNILVADTYNHKIKRIDPERREITTVLDTLSRAAGAESGQVALNEPSGLAKLGSAVLIADTNNDRLLLFDPDSGSVEPWPLSGLSRKPVADKGPEADESRR